jgi:hypothetical protein
MKIKIGPPPSHNSTHWRDIIFIPYIDKSSKEPRDRSRLREEPLGVTFQRKIVQHLQGRTTVNDHLPHDEGRVNSLVTRFSSSIIKERKAFLPRFFVANLLTQPAGSLSHTVAHAAYMQCGLGNLAQEDILAILYAAQDKKTPEPKKTELNILALQLFLKPYFVHTNGDFPLPNTNLLANQFDFERLLFKHIQQPNSAIDPELKHLAEVVYTALPHFLNNLDEWDTALSVNIKKPSDRFKSLRERYSNILPDSQDREALSRRAIRNSIRYCHSPLWQWTLAENLKQHEQDTEFFAQLITESIQKKGLATYDAIFRNSGIQEAGASGYLALLKELGNTLNDPLTSSKDHGRHFRKLAFLLQRAELSTVLSPGLLDLGKRHEDEIWKQLEKMLVHRSYKLPRHSERDLLRTLLINAALSVLQTIQADDTPANMPMRKRMLQSFVYEASKLEQQDKPGKFPSVLDVIESSIPEPGVLGKKMLNTLKQSMLARFVMETFPQTATLKEFHQILEEAHQKYYTEFHLNPSFILTLFTSRPDFISRNSAIFTELKTMLRATRQQIEAFPNIPLDPTLSKKEANEIKDALLEHWLESAELIVQGQQKGLFIEEPVAKEILFFLMALIKNTENLNFSQEKLKTGLIPEQRVSLLEALLVLGERSKTVYPIIFASPLALFMDMELLMIDDETGKASTRVFNLQQKYERLDAAHKENGWKTNYELTDAEKKWVL